MDDTHRQSADVSAIPTLPAYLLWPFYDTEQLIANLRKQGARSSVLVGARGSGKSTLFRDLCRSQLPYVADIPPKEAEVDQAVEKLVIRGKSPHLAYQRLRTIADRDATGDIYIDDVDKMYLRAKAIDHRLFAKIDRALWNLLDLTGPSSTDRHVVASWSERWPDDSPVTWAASNIWSQNDPQYLEPWKIDWPDVVKKGFAVLSKYYRTSTVNFAGVTADVDDDLIDTWVVQAIALTGGQPELMSAALVSLRERIEGAAHEGRASDDTPDAESLRKAIRAVVELHLTRTALPQVRTRIANLRDSGDDVDRAALELLSKVAFGTRSIDRSAFDSKAIVRIERESLAHFPQHSGKLENYGSLVHDILTEFAAQKPVPMSLELVFDEPHTETKGQLIATAPGTRAAVPLAGAAWMMLRELMAQEGDTVKMEKLKASFGNNAAVRAAVQRLTGKLKEYDLDMIENVRGEGYRIIAPMWKAKK